MEALFLKVLRMSATASAVILAVLLARLLLRRAPKAFSYALWAVVLFRLLCPFSIESAFSLLPAVQTRPSGDGMGTVQIYTGISAVNNQVNGYLSEHPYPVASVPAPAQGVSTNPGVPAESAAPMEAAPAEKTPINWLGLGQWVWLAGVALMLAYSLVSLLRLRRRLVGFVPLEGEKNVRLADHIPSPFVLGVFRPKIYLPSGLPENERDYILLHERTHIRRGDHIFRALAWLALAVHWFNPLVWLAFHLAGKDMEMSCDEAVLRKMGRDVRADYSSSLLRLSTGRRLPAGPLAFGEGNPQSRIKNVLHWKKPARWVMAAALAAVVCAGVALATDRSGLFIDPDSVAAVSMSTRVFLNTEYVSDTALRDDLFDSDSPYVRVVAGEDGKELARLINTSHKTLFRRGDPKGWGLDDWVLISCQDGGYYLVHYYYWSSFCFGFHGGQPHGEDDYVTLVTYYDASGEAGATWRMECEFDNAFLDWRRKVSRGIGEMPDPNGDIAAELTLSLDDVGNGPFVRITGTADGVELNRVTWQPEGSDALFGEHPGGELGMAEYKGDGWGAWVTAWWTDGSRTSVTLSTKMSAMLSSYASSGWWEFRVNVENGLLNSMIERPNQPVNMPEDTHYYPELIPEADAIRAGRIAAKLLTAAEDYYNNAMADGAAAQQPPDGVDLSGLTFSDGWYYNRTNLEGLDSGPMYWQSPGRSIYSQGDLYFTDPAFLGPAFEGRQIKGSIGYADDSHTSMRGWLSSENPYGYTQITWDLAEGIVAHDEIDIGLSDGDLLSMARVFARLIDRVEAYRISNAYRPAQEGALPFDEPIELLFSWFKGGWATHLLLNPDGSFDGTFMEENEYHDDVYVCQFSGQFGDIAQVTDGSWSMVLEELVIGTGHPIGESWLENGRLCTAATPYGLDTADRQLPDPGARFMLYTPAASGHSTDDELYGLDSSRNFDSGYGDWLWWPDMSIFEPGSDSTLGCYALFNVETGHCFLDMSAWGH